MFIGIVTLFYIGTLFSVGLNFKKASDLLENSKEAGEIVDRSFLITLFITFFLVVYLLTK